MEGSLCKRSSRCYMFNTQRRPKLLQMRQLYFWPGMTKDIKLMVSQCSHCVPLLPSQRLEEQIQTVASRPFEAMSTDLGYYKGTHYLVLVDRYSGWPLVKPLKKLDTATVTSTLEDWFLDYGKPVERRSDVGLHCVSTHRVMHR